MCHRVPCPSKRLVHIGLIMINIIALTGWIITTSHMAHIRIHGNLIIMYSLRRRHHMTIVIIFIGRFPTKHMRRHIASGYNCTRWWGDNVVIWSTNSQETVRDIRGDRHEKGIWRNGYGGRWEIWWNVIGGPNVCTSIITLKRVNPSVKTRWREQTSPPQIEQRVEYEHSQTYEKDKGLWFPQVQLQGPHHDHWRMIG